MDDAAATLVPVIDVEIWIWEKGGGGGSFGNVFSSCNKYIKKNPV